MYPKKVICPRCDTEMRIQIFFNPRPTIFWCHLCGCEVEGNEVREECICEDYKCPNCGTAPLKRGAQGEWLCLTCEKIECGV